MVDPTKSETFLEDEVTRLKKALANAEARLATLPQWDKLTKLPNKFLFEDRLNQAMARARRSQRLMSVIYLDTEHTKLITAKLGVVGKNELTRAFTGRFQTAIRETDTLARVGFDRYAVIMEEIKSVKQVKTIVSKIIDSIDKGFVIDSNDIAVKVSVGVTFYEGSDETMASILSSVEKALIKAKKAGESSYEIGGLLIK